MTNMKNIFLLLFALLSFAGCKKASKYTITTNGVQYWTNSYSKDASGCIVFKNDGCGCGGDPETVTVCGNYSITKNSGNEKE